MQLSVVIPTHNRAGLLRRCLEALGRQSQAADTFEVVVVDDGSTGDTTTMLHALSTPYRLRSERRPWAGQAAAMNRGVELATAEVCLFLDDDILPSPGLVRAHLHAQREREGVAIGHIELAADGRLDWFARHHAEAWRAHYERLGRGAAPSWRDAFSGNLSVPRTAVRAVGGFAIDLPRSYDIELAYRLERHGLRLRYLADAVGVERYGKGVHEVLHDAQRAGAAAVMLYQRHRAMLPLLELGGRGELGLAGRLARRAVLASGCSIPSLARAVSLPTRDEHQRLLYRFLFSCAYWRGVDAATGSADRRAFERGVTVLMYHAVADRGARPTRYVIDAGRFSRQMAWLARRRYRVLTHDELLALRTANELPPPRAVLLTFDDAYADLAGLAWPILSRHGYTATVFCVTGRAGRVMDWDDDGELAGRPLLDWAQLRDLTTRGMGCGAHSRTHPPLTVLAPADLEGEVHGSRVDLERALDRPVATFAYPYGKSDETVRGAARDAGFELAFGVEPGRNRAATPPLALHRNEIHGTDSLLRFGLTLWLGTTLRRPR